MTNKLVTALSVTVLLLAMKPAKTHAQVALASVIKAGVKKVIKAIDLKVQRLQNKTIWLQNAQKIVENKLAKSRLGQIAEWTEKQRTLYKKYFDDLSEVRQSVKYYHQVRYIVKRQKELLKTYQTAWNSTKHSDEFSVSELSYIAKVYGGILNNSIDNLESTFLVMSDFKTSMSDAERLKTIRNTAAKIDENYFDLIEFNRQNKQLRLARERELQEIRNLKTITGIN
ncbi:conjugal transfer protein TraI [Pelobium manganitolerans]|uniref:conjugal transfer protein TraI n=1 Tax=Pelobium manganitolerans TaxID=1842495 RepID=UPI003FA3D5F0